MTLTSNNRITRSLAMDKDLVQALEAQARTENRTFSNLVETRLRTFLTANGTLAPLDPTDPALCAAPRPGDDTHPD